MANFNNIKNEIDQNVNTNGQQAITGAILNQTLKDMLDDVDTQKQDTLVAGQNITISGNVISATGGGSGPVYTAGQGINIDGNNEISVDASDLAGSGLEVDEFGALKTDPNLIQSKLTAGQNITISGNTISATDTTYSAGSGLNLTGTTFSADTTVLQEKLQDGTAININGTNINLQYGDGLTIDGNGKVAVDTTTIQPKLTAGSGISISAQNVISATGGGGGGTTYGDGDAISIDSNDNINVLYGNGLQLDGNGNLELDQTAITSFLPLVGGTLQDSSDTELLVLDGNSEDYVKIVAPETAGVQPHVEIFENGSGDTKFFYDHIERGSQVSIDLPSSSGTLALTSDIPSASSLAGTGLQDDGNGALEIDTTVVATQTDLSGYLPLEGGVLHDASAQATQLEIQSPTNANTHVLISSKSSGQQESYVNISAFDFGSFSLKSATFFNDRLEDTSGHKIFYPTVSSNETLAVVSDIPTASTLAGNGLQDDGNGQLEVDTTVIQEKLVAGTNITISGNVISASGGGGGNYLPLDGGVLSDTTGNAATALNITPATGQVGGGTVYINSSPSVQVGSSNSANGYTSIGQNAIQLNDGNGNDLLITNTGFDDGTYTASLPTLTQNETLATLSDLSGKQDTLTAGSGITIQNNVISATGGGGSGLWTNGTGTDSLMTPDAVSSGSTAAGTAALNAGHYDSSHSSFPSAASGNYSAVFGTGNTASGADSFVSGEWNKAQGQSSAILGGRNSVISATSSASVGGDNSVITSNGTDSVIIGGGYINAADSVAIAGGRVESGADSIAIGANAETHAGASVAIGTNYPKAYTYGSGSVAIGTDSTTDGADSVALGLGSRAKNSGEVGIGQFNKSYQSATSSVATQFTVGNGTTSGGTNTYSNSIEVKKNNDIYVVGIGGFDGTNSGTAGVETLQDVINNGGGSGTTFTAGDGLELDANDNLNVLYGSGLTLSANNELEVDPTSITGFLPLEGGSLQQTDPNNTATILSIQSPNGNETIDFTADEDYDGAGNGKSVIAIGDVNGSINIGTDGISDGTYTTSWPSPSADTTFATLEDVSGYLPLVGGTLQEEQGNASTDLVIQSPESYATAAIETVDLDPGNTSESMAKITLSDYDSSNNAHEAVYTSTGISDGTYTLSFPTLSQDETIATLSDIQGGGGTSYTAGTGISISAQNVISNTAPDPGFWVAGTGTNSIMTSTASNANGSYAVAIGSGSQVNPSTTSMYNTAIAGGQIGNLAMTGIQHATAIGSGAYCTKSDTVALGTGTRAMNVGEASIGYYSNSIDSGTTAEKTRFTVGNGTGGGARSNLIEAKQNNDIYVVGVGGFDGTNAGTSGVETLQQAIANAGSGSSLWTSGTGTDSLVAPATITAGLSVDPAQGTGAISCGYDTNADGDYAFASGAQALASGDYSFAANNGTAAGDYSAAFNTSGANGERSFAAGDGSTAGGSRSIALGGGTTLYDDSDPNNIIDAEDSVAIGASSVANAPLSVAIGSSATAGGTGALAFGSGSQAYGLESVAFPESSANAQVSVGMASGQASGEFSVAMSGGWTLGSNSVAGGLGTYANACSSVALGLQTMTYDGGIYTDPTDANAGETALGRYNYTEQDIIFSVGCGQEIYHDPNDPDFQPNPDDPDSPDPWTEIIRQNAITITTDGSIYIKGLGQYTGTQISGATSLQTLLANV